MNNVKAFVFDMFGTALDWRASIIAELEAQGKRHGIEPGRLPFPDTCPANERFRKEPLIGTTLRYSGGKSMW